MPPTQTSGHTSSNTPCQDPGTTTVLGAYKCAEDRALPSSSTLGDYKKRAQDEYLDKAPNKLIEVHHMDCSRRSMYRDLQVDYERKLAWAKSLGIDPFAEKFDPTVPAPPELSSWLYLFYAYLQLEEVYAEALEWLNCTGHRLIDPEPPWSWEEVQELWRHIRETFAKDHSRPGSRASQHKRY
ncbi:g2345 [Coccomyxa viridis]|uniref:G2345 protein n=1 Tax=Coccomyxa viridis TaxID=1274662 RepID=A0ABP1FMD9_9CHLO